MASAGVFDGASFSWSARRAYFCAKLSDLWRASAGTASMAMLASDTAMYIPTRPLWPVCAICGTGLRPIIAVGAVLRGTL
jgi:hypothetical protein